MRITFWGILFCFMLGLGICDAQVTKIYGKVTDAVTKEPLPFVNVFFKEKNFGTATDFYGVYSLETKIAGDTIETSIVGYLPQKVKIQRGKYQEINIHLQPSSYNLNPVEIKYDENPADVIMRKVLSKKDKNDINGLSSYQYEAYTKIQMDVNNIKDRLKRNRLLKPFNFIFDNMDTSTINGKTYLPALLSEVVSDVFYRKSPKSTIEIIKGSRISGIADESFTQLLGDLYQKVNVYDNYIMLFEKNFVSPAANFGSVFYKYYLTDSTYIQNQWCYKIMFKPRRKQELTFSGELWVHDTSFAIKKVDMRIANDANINFINDAKIKQSYTLTDFGQWMISNDQLIVDFNLVLDIKNTIGLYGTKTASFKNYVFNQPKPDKFYNVASKIIAEDEATERNETYWKSVRHDSLSKNEKGIYAMVDSVQSVPAYKNYVDIIRILFTGFKRFGNIEVGSYLTLYSYNKNEGSRFKLDVATSNLFSKKVKYNVYSAYGIKDQTLKYGGGLIYVFNKDVHRVLKANYKYDVEQLGESQMAFRQDNFFASILRRTPANKLTMVREYHAETDYTWFNGFSNTLQLTHRQMYPLGGTTFEINRSQFVEKKSLLTTSEVELDARLALKEKFLTGAFKRASLGTPFPVLEARFVKGFSNVFSSDYDYSKLQLLLHQWVNVGSFGWFKYIIEAGQIWGKLPYPLLKIHEGNEALSFDEYAFNLMNYYEFVSDRYVSAYVTHHFEGLFLNRIPLLRKLKWREVVYAKGVIGSLSKGNRSFSVFPEYMSTVEKPYYEAGLGVENILKILRLDAVWRLSHLDHPKIAKFTILATIQFTF